VVDAAGTQYALDVTVTNGFWILLVAGILLMMRRIR
jgi:hypothetical protein